MATCKDCIHNCVCSLWRREEGQDAKFYAETEDGKCEHFADESRYIEIPTEPEQRKSVSMMIWEMITRAESHNDIYPRQTKKESSNEND